MFVVEQAWINSDNLDTSNSQSHRIASLFSTMKIADMPNERNPHSWFIHSSSRECTLPHHQATIQFIEKSHTAVLGRLWYTILYSKPIQLHLWTLFLLMLMATWVQYISPIMYQYVFMNETNMPNLLAIVLSVIIRDRQLAPKLLAWACLNHLSYFRLL